MRFLMIFVAIVSAAAQVPPSGKAAYDAFLEWKKTHAAGNSEWVQIISRYRSKLKSDGLDVAAVTRAIQAIEAYDEAVLYNGVYAAAPTFNTQPNRLLVEAIRGRAPGKALDTAMGQGRNAVYLAGQGWEVMGFDMSAVGIRKAEQLA